MTYITERLFRWPQTLFGGMIENNLCLSSYTTYTPSKRKSCGSAGAFVGISIRYSPHRWMDSASPELCAVPPPLLAVDWRLSVIVVVVHTTTFIFVGMISPLNFLFHHNNSKLPIFLRVITNDSLRDPLGAMYLISIGLYTICNVPVVVDTNWALPLACMA